MTIAGERIPFGAACAGVLLTAFALVALAAPVIAPLDPNQQDLFARLKPREPRCAAPSTSSVRMNSAATS